MPRAPCRWAASPARKQRPTRKRAARRCWAVWSAAASRSKRGSSPHQPVRVEVTRVSRVSPVTMPGQVACGSIVSVGEGRPGGSRQSSRQTPSGSGRAEASRSPRHGGSRCSRAPSKGRSTRTVAMALRSTAGRPGKRIFRSLRTVDLAPSQPTRWLPRHQVVVPFWVPVVRMLTPSRSCSSSTTRLSGTSLISGVPVRASRRPRWRRCWGRWKVGESVRSIRSTSWRRRQMAKESHRAESETARG